MGMANMLAPTVDLADEPDHALVQRVVAGDTAAFELLMRRHNERVYRAARAIVRDEHVRKRRT